VAAMPSSGCEVWAAGGGVRDGSFVAYWLASRSRSTAGIRPDQTGRGSVRCVGCDRWSSLWSLGGSHADQSSEDDRCIVAVLAR
jgi:hypothetical protein